MRRERDDSCVVIAKLLVRTRDRSERNHPSISYAEREGFEPSRRLPAYTLSKRTSSATRAPLLDNCRQVFPAAEYLNIPGRSLEVKVWPVAHLRLAGFSASLVDYELVLVAKIGKTFNKTKFLMRFTDLTAYNFADAWVTHGRLADAKRSSSKSCQAFDVVCRATSSTEVFQTSATFFATFGK